MLLDRIARVLSPVDAYKSVPLVLGDHFIDETLNDRFNHEVANGIGNASVLIPLILRNGRVKVMFTQRPAFMRVHPNRWVFPGGKFDPEHDINHADTALRETFEETGITKDRITMIGRLPPFWVCSDLPNRSGICMSAFVGILETPFDLNLNPDEVAAVRELPLYPFIRAGQASIEDGEFIFKTRGIVVSGSTAAQLVMLANRLARRPTLSRQMSPT